MANTTDVIVIGAGIIGTTVAWRCAQRGLTVCLFDPDPAQGAWHTAAGMLAPVTEAHYTETPLLRQNLKALARYPAFVAELTELTGLATGFQSCGTVTAAWDAADLAGLHDLHRFLDKLDVRAELLNGPQLRDLEPGLASGLPGGLYAPDDHQVDPRLLHAALMRAAQRAGVRVEAATATIRRVADRVVGVVAADTEHHANTVVLAAGAWSGSIDAAAGYVPPVRPVKGQTLRLRTRYPIAQHVVRGSVKGTAVYAVPRADRHIVIGASTEEAGFDVSSRAGAMYELLRDAQSLLPELADADFIEASAGLRPCTPDNAPLVGPSDVPGLVMATGHYRNGVLLAPITADAIANLLADTQLDDHIQAFTPTRFDKAVST